MVHFCFMSSLKIYPQTVVLLIFTVKSETFKLQPSKLSESPKIKLVLAFYTAA